MNPLERFERYAGRIERHNPVLNAFLHLRLEAAAEEATASAARHEKGEALSPIDGVCIAVKANIAVAGLAHHAGIGAYRDDIALHDAEAVARLKAAGAVILGIVNMHEGALGATTDNSFFGRTDNPWREGFTPGGSSGGSAAAVAAGLCDGALGSDTMGSVRIPSAYCGCQGHKPTTGLVPNGGVLALSHTLDHVGPHARKVETLADMLAVLAGEAVALESLQPRGLTLGVWEGSGEIDCTPGVASAFARACERLEAEGARLVASAPPGYEYGRARRAGLLISEVEATEIHAERLAADPEGFSEGFRGLMAWGARQPAEKIEAAYDLVGTLREAAAGAFDEVDAIIAPTAPQQAFDFEEPVPANQADFTAWANLAGLPATAVFTGIEGGLPASLQVIGPAGADVRTLSIAAALESVFGAPPVAPAFRG